MKKVLALLLSAVMLFALCACGSSAPAQTEAPAAPAEEGKADAPASRDSGHAGGLRCDRVQRCLRRHVASDGKHV